jgi:hypothetical protein
LALSFVRTPLLSCNALLSFVPTNKKTFTRCSPSTLDFPVAVHGGANL